MIGDLINMICNSSPMLTVVCGAAGLVILGITGLVSVMEAKF